MTEESFGKGSGLLLGAQIYYKLTGFLVFVAMGRTLGAEDIGRFFFATSVCATVMVLANLNVNPLLTRWLARATGRRPLGEEIGALLGFRLLMAPLFLAAIGAFALVFHRDEMPILLCAALFTLGEDVYFSLGAVFIALRRVRYNVAIGVVVQTIVVAALVLGLWWRPRLSTLIATSFLRSILLVVVALLVMHTRVVPLRVRRPTGYGKESLPFIGLLLFAVLAEQMDTVLLGAMVGYEAVAAYGYALRAVWALVFVPQALATVLYPRLVASGLEGEHGVRFRRTLAAAVALGLLAAAGTWICADLVARILYPKMASATAPLLRALGPYVALVLPQTLVVSILPALGRERRALLATVAGAAVLVAGNLLALPTWGVAAAPLVRALASATQLVIAASGLLRGARARRSPPAT